jgi:endonuclease/exonuclease/phosphatase family metal-dependent hydrolase
MILITWNVQWCRGMDNVVDPARIARVARNLADFDVLCLQEVAINFPGLPGSSGEDQVSALAAALPGYTAIYGPATDTDDGKGRRSQFGNTIFTRLPVIQVYRHLRPGPADATVLSMQRMALEAVVLAPSGPMRVVTTHLEFYSATQRMAQVEALRRIHTEACGHARAPRVSGKPGEPFQAFVRPATAIICGDFNFKPQDLEHGRMIAAPDPGAQRLFDAWTAVHPNEPHPPTMGVFEKTWPLYCCDFAFATDDVIANLRSVSVDATIDASDHQPLMLELAD